MDSDFFMQNEPNSRSLQDGASKGYTLRKPARRQARPTLDRVAHTDAEWDGQARKLRDACPPGDAGIMASGERRVVSGTRTVASSQWSVKRKRGSWRCEKSAKTKPMEIGHKSLGLTELTLDGFGLLYAKRTQFRVALRRDIEGLAMPEASVPSTFD